METVYSQILDLVRSGITGRSVTFDQKIDWETIIEISEHQALYSIIFRAIRISKPEIDGGYLNQFRLGFANDIRTNRFQCTELKQLFHEFDQRGIDYFPLKGVVMKDYYPGPEYRWMSDADIYIRRSQYDEIETIMKAAGYEFQYESEHELKWKKSGFYIEYHKAAGNPQYVEYSDCFGDVFKGAVKEENSSRYHFTSTNALVYSIAHLAQHYMSGGTRLRSLIDLYYILQKENIDRDKLLEELDRMKLCSFFRIIEKAIRQWFGAEPMDEESEVVFVSVLSEYKTFGDLKSFAYQMANENHGNAEASFSSKLKSGLKRFFLPYSIMQKRFTILRKLPFLLPVFWLYRGIEAILFRRTKLKKVLSAQYSDHSSFVGEYMKDIKTLGLEEAAVPEEI